MADYRTFFDKEYLGAWDLGGKDRVVTIEAVTPGKVGGHKGKKAAKKPILSFAGKEKKLACNITNAGTIAAMYGPNVKAWVGKRITLYPTTTTFGSDTVDCVRIRPMPPAPGRDTSDSLSREVDPDARARQNAARQGADRG